MKKNNRLQGAIVALLLASPLVVNAGQYPAADFEPKVLYQDSSVQAAPAASVVKVAPVASSSSAPVAEVNDTKYPAANFEPKVLFKDENYKPSKSTPSAPEFKSSSAAVVMEQSATKTESGSESNLLILGALAAAIGFVVYSKKNKSVSTGGNVQGNRETGVTRYLNARVPKISGVTKYLERTGQPTNVARYIARQNLAQKAAAQNDAGRG